MNKTEKMMSQAAQRFSNRCEAMSYNKGESHVFWLGRHNAHHDDDHAVVATSNSPNAST